MYQQMYGFTLLDDLHNFYPEILYGDPNQWSNVSQLVGYIQRQTQDRFNLYSRAGRQWMAVQQHLPHQATQPTQTTQGTAPPPPPPQVQETPSVPPPPVAQPPRPATQETVTPQRRVRPRMPPNAPLRMSHRSIRIPPPGNSPAYLSENEEDDDIESTHVASSLIHTIQNMMTQDPLTATVQSMLDLGSLPRRTTPLTYLYTTTLNNEDVPIVPSQSDISRATRIYNATTADTDSEDVCAICQDTYADGQPIRRIMHCDHKFHKSCIDTWFGRNVHCPVCRHDIRET